MLIKTCNLKKLLNHANTADTALRITLGFLKLYWQENIAGFTLSMRYEPT